MAVTGRAPGTVVGDRGFGTVANDQALAALGVKRVGLQRTGTPGKARLAVERTRAFRRLRNWRVRVEAPISHLKGSFGLRRTRLRRLGGARTWVGWDLRRQPAAHDRGRRMTRTLGARSTNQPAQQTHAYQDFFRSK